MTQCGLLVSVVVPTCGRRELLNRCIDALARQDLPTALYEIIVVDDRPAQETFDLVEAWAAQGGACIRYFANHGARGPAAARNLGWGSASAPIIAFTDDDTVPAPRWLSSGLAAFGPQVDAVCGRIAMPLPAVPTDYERDASRLETAEFVTANCFCRKPVLQRLNGFDPRFRLAWREDSDFHFRLLEAGACIVRAPDALVVHPVRPAQWGVSVMQQKKIVFDALLYKKHPRLYRERIRAAPRWDYYATVALLALAAGGFVAGAPALAAAGALGWVALTARFCLARLRGASWRWSHVAEMALTSALIPPHAVFWRIVGALRYRVRFV